MADFDKSIDGGEQRIAHLMNADDQAFVREAYLLVLGRGADPAGESFYGTQLKAGASRREILQNLADSDEGRQYLASRPQVAAALRGGAPASVPGSSSLADLLRMKDSDFVEASIRLLLDQGADVATRTTLIARLRGGTPRQRVLIELAAANGRHSFPDIAGLDVLLKRTSDKLFPVAETLDDLLAMQDEAFVDCAYKTLLRREPDFAGVTHYVGRIREGYSRSSVLCELAASSEARSGNASLPGLARLCRAHRLARIPVLGRAVARVLRVEDESRASRQARQLASLMLRNYALQAQFDAVRGAASVPSRGSNGLEQALLARQEAMIEIQRDSFDREINALRKLVVGLLDKPGHPASEPRE